MWLFYLLYTLHLLLNLDENSTQKKRNCEKDSLRNNIISFVTGVSLIESKTINLRMKHEVGDNVRKKKLSQIWPSAETSVYFN